MPAFANCLPIDPNVIYHVPPDQLVRREQDRKVFEHASLLGLAESIRQHGVIQPIVCYLDGYEGVVLEGERRVRAAIIAGVARVPVRVLTDPMDIAAIQSKRLVANLQRVDLNAVEKAAALQGFMTSSGLTAAQAAARLGLPPSEVSKALAVNTLSAEHKALVIANTICADAAYWLTRVDDPAQRDGLAQRAAKGELTRDALAREVRALVVAKSAPTKPAGTSAAKPSPTKVAVWRMTRTIGLGVALAVTGTGLTLEELVALLDAFVARAREAIGKRVPVARFLSEFRYDAGASNGATP